MNFDEIQRIIKENESELTIIEGLLGEVNTPPADVKESIDFDEVMQEVRRLNPGVFFELDKDNKKINASVRGDQLRLPDGFEYNDKNGITNKHHTASGEYIAIDVRPISKETKRRISEYKGISKKALEDRKNFLVEQKNLLETFKQNANKTIDEIRDLNDKIKAENDASKRKELSKQLKAKKNELNNQKRNVRDASQGKGKEVLSNLFGQIDKRVHNLLYRNNKVGNALWNTHCSYVRWRYNHPVAYGALGVAIAGGILIGLSALGTAFPVVYAATGAYLASATVKSVHTFYNNFKYGQMPQLVQQKTLRKGSFVENIKNALLERNRTKAASKNIKINRKDLKNGNTQVNRTNDNQVNNEDQTLNEYRNRLNNCDVDSLTVDNLTEDKARELNELVSALSANRSKLTEEEREKLDKISTLLSEYFNKENNNTNENTSENENTNENNINRVNDPVVQRIIDEVNNLDLDNLDAQVVAKLLNDFNKLKPAQKNIISKDIYLKLGKAAKKLREAGVSLDYSENKNSDALQLNALIRRVNLEKIQQFLDGKRLEELGDDKKQSLYRIHDELEDVKQIMSIISSNKVNSTSLDGENIDKLYEIMKLFGKNNLRVSNVMPNKVEIVLYDVVSNSGRNFAGYSAVCNFYKDSEKYYEKTMFVEKDNIDYLREKMQELFGFNGKIIVRKATKDDYSEDYNELYEEHSDRSK